MGLRRKHLGLSQEGGPLHLVPGEEEAALSGPVEEEGSLLSQELTTGNRLARAK